MRTLLHFGLRKVVVDGHSGRPREVISLKVGDLVREVPDLEPGIGSYSPEPEGIGNACRFLVAFNPSCFQCWKAARARAENRGGTVQAVWIAAEPRGDSREFEQALPSRDRVLWDSGVAQALQVGAVPAAFLVRDDRRLARVWPCSDKEQDKDLVNWC